MTGIAAPAPVRRHISPGMVGVACVAFGVIVFGTLALAGPVTAMVAAAAVVAVVVTIALCGVRATVILAGLLAISPSVIGESSSRWSLVASIAVAIVVVSAPVDRPASTVTKLAVAAAPLCIAIGMLSSSGRLINIATIYAVTSVAGFAMVSRAVLARRVLKAVALFVTVMTASYAISLATGFAGHIADLAFPTGRNLTVYAPFTMTTGGTTFFAGGPPRMVLLVGEPGMDAFFLVPALAFFITNRSVRMRLFGLVIFATAVLFSQSSGLLIGSGISLGVGAVYWMITRRMWVRALIVVAAVWFALSSGIRTILDFRTINGAGSITDRGIFNAGDASAASLGNINLIVTLQHDLILGLALIVALLLLLPLGLRTPAAAAAFTLFAVAATFLEPSQWQIGAWLLLSTTLTATLPSRAQQVSAT